MCAIRVAALVAGSLALVQLVVFCQPNNQQQLCGNGKIKLRSINDLHRTSTRGCPLKRHVGPAFEALKELVKEPNVCTMDKASNVISFYEDYLRDPNWQASKSKEQILIEKFAVAYGLQTSRVCRRAMARGLFGKASKSLQASDFKFIEEWTRNDSPIARLLSSITKSGEFLLPSDFSSFTPEVTDKLRLKMKEDNGKILSAKEVCEKRFRPLYEPTVLPVAYLARNGLNHQALFDEIPLVIEDKWRKKHALWSRIVFVCESLKDIEVVEAPVGSISQSGDAVANKRASEAKSTIDLPWVTRYEPFSLINGDIWGGESHLKEAGKFHLYSSANFRLTSAMRSFNVTMSESDRFRNRLLSNKWGLLLATFKSNEQTRTLLKKAFMMAMAGWQRERHEDQELESVKKDLLGLVDAKKNSTIFRILAKILRGSMKVVFALAFMLEIVFALSVAVVYLGASILDIGSYIIMDEPILTRGMMKLINEF